MYCSCNSQEMAWYSEIHKSDSEDESVVDDEPTTPTMYSSSQSLQSEGTLYECASMTSMLPHWLFVSVQIVGKEAACLISPLTHQVCIHHAYFHSSITCVYTCSTWATWQDCKTLHCCEFLSV